MPIQITPPLSFQTLFGKAAVTMEQVLDHARVDLLGSRVFLPILFDAQKKPISFADLLRGSVSVKEVDGNPIAATPSPQNVPEVMTGGWALFFGGMIIHKQEVLSLQKALPSPLSPNSRWFLENVLTDLPSLMSLYPDSNTMDGLSFFRHGVKADPVSLVRRSLDIFLEQGGQKMQIVQRAETRDDITVEAVTGFYVESVDFLRGILISASHAVQILYPDHHPLFTLAPREEEIRREIIKRAPGSPSITVSKAPRKTIQIMEPDRRFPRFSKDFLQFLGIPFSDF